MMPRYVVFYIQIIYPFHFFKYLYMSLLWRKALIQTNIFVRVKVIKTTNTPANMFGMFSSSLLSMKKCYKLINPGALDWKFTRLPWYLFNSCEILSESKSVRMISSKYRSIGRASYHILPWFLLKYQNLIRYMCYVII